MLGRLTLRRSWRLTELFKSERLRSAMPLRSILSCFALIVMLRSSILCDGRSDETEPELNIPAVPGSHHLSRVGSDLKRETAPSTRPGSLTFTYDQTGDLNSTKALHSAKLKRLAPSVHCGSNHMMLSVKRRGTHHFLIDSGEVPLTPLSQMPSTCGFFVKRSRRDVQYAASYQGCHVDKRDSEYSLPLRLWGTPMTMSCPDMLPMPSIFCFPNKMVVKIRGVAVNQLKVKVSGTWQPLSSACSSCRLNFNESSGELTLIAPYNKDLCVEIKDEEYLLSLQWADLELTASCPLVPIMDLTTGTTPPSSDNNEALHLQYPMLPIFSQFLEQQSKQSPGLVAPLPFSFVSADFSENQKTPENMSPPLPPNLYWFPRLGSPTHPSGDENAHVNQLQLPQTPLSPYQIPLFREFPMIPGVFLPTTTTSPVSSTSTENIITNAAPIENEKPQLSQQPDFRMILQYPFSPFPIYPKTPQDQTQEDVESKPQHLPPQHIQLPMMYAFNNFPHLQNAPTSAPVATTEAPPPENPFYQPHPYIPVYVVSKQVPIPVFLNHPVTASSNSGPSDQNEHQHFYHAMQPFYHFLPDQSQTAQTNT